MLTSVLRSAVLSTAVVLSATAGNAPLFARKPDTVASRGGLPAKPVLTPRVNKRSRGLVFCSKTTHRSGSIEILGFCRAVAFIEQTLSQNDS